MIRSSTSPITVIGTVGAVVLLLAISISPVAAADAPTPTNQTAAPQTDTPEVEQPAGEWIDNATMLISSSYDRSEGTATVRLRSQIPQKVVISDAGVFMDGGGAVEQRSVLMQPGETATITMPVTETQDGFVGVSINTQKTLYAEPIKMPGISLSPPQRSDWLAMIVAIVMILATILAINWGAHKLYGDGVVSVDG